MIESSSVCRSSSDGKACSSMAPIRSGGTPSATEGASGLMQMSESTHTTCSLPRLAAGTKPDTSAKRDFVLRARSLAFERVGVTRKAHTRAFEHRRSSPAAAALESLRIRGADRQRYDCFLGHRRASPRLLTRCRDQERLQAMTDTPPCGKATVNVSKEAHLRYRGGASACNRRCRKPS
jgi:hypothetical protein